MYGIPQMLLVLHGCSRNDGNERIIHHMLSSFVQLINLEDDDCHASVCNSILPDVSPLVLALPCTLCQKWPAFA